MAVRASLVRLAQGIGSQGLSSASNFALTVAVAHQSTLEEFGAFAVAHALSVLVVPMVRAAVGETLAVTDHRGRDGMGAGVLAGAAVAVMLACGAWVASGPLAVWMGWFAVAVPLMVLQDTARAVGFARGAPSVAVRSDAVWLAVQAVGWTVALVAGYGSVGVLFAVWVTGCVAGTAAVIRDVEVPSLVGGAQWLRTHRGMASGLTVDALAGLAPSHATLYVLGVVAGLPAAGAMRGMETLYGPVRSALIGVRSVALPEAFRRYQTGRSHMTRYLVRLSAAAGMVAAAAVVVVAALPDPAGQLVLDEVWVDASTVAVPLGLSMVASAAYTGVRLYLRVLHAVRVILTLRVVNVTVATTGGVAGAMFGGLQAAAWGLAGAQTATVLVGLALVRATGGRAARRRTLV